MQASNPFWISSSRATTTEAAEDEVESASCRSGLQRSLGSKGKARAPSSNESQVLRDVDRRLSKNMSPTEARDFLHRVVLNLLRENDSLRGELKKANQEAEAAQRAWQTECQGKLTALTRLEQAGMEKAKLELELRRMKMRMEHLASQDESQKSQIEALQKQFQLISMLTHAESRHETDAYDVHRESSEWEGSRLQVLGLRPRDQSSSHGSPRGEESSVANGSVRSSRTAATLKRLLCTKPEENSDTHEWEEM